SPGMNYDAKEQVRQLLASLAIKQLKLPKKKEETNPIPFVDERSPALRMNEPVGEPWFGRLLVWLCLIGALVAIGWLTVEGMGRVRENPRAAVERLRSFIRNASILRGVGWWRFQQSIE
ncbi:hypothetical protein N9B30_04695, partial [Akkermansiaceae bacterium]|nr:hypothetical protein [Akkermansiaceae bacterium]